MHFPVLIPCGAFLAATGALACAQNQPDFLLRVFAEDFRGTAQRDIARTSADWADAFPGSLRPGAGGGYGIHGDLRVEQGVRVINVADLIPPAQTRFGGWLGPVGGAFHFSSIYVAPGATLRFIGLRGARIYAASVDIQGTLDVSGESAPLHFPTNDPCPLDSAHPWVSNDIGRGGNAGRGGPGGGNGGTGGDDPRPNLTAPSGMPNNPGSTARLDPQHLDGEPGQGPGAGGGSPHFPATTISSSFQARLANVDINAALLYCLQRSAGAGGGSFLTAGSNGQDEIPFSGNAGTGGPLPNFDLNLPPALAPAGSGGGGGAVHPYFTNRIPSRFGNCKPAYPQGSRPTINGNQVVERWSTGAGGGGGGGYIYVQCADLNLAGSLLARGGDGGSGASFGATLPGTEAVSGGGGGSGGAIRLDLTRSVNLAGGAFIDVQGGFGGRSSLSIRGGAGGAGAVHIRERVSSSSFAQLVRPPASLGVGAWQSADEHPFSFATSGYYRSQAGQPVQRLVDSIVTFAVKRTNAPGPVDPTDPRFVFNVGVPGSLLVHLGPAYISYQVAQDDGNGNPVAGTESLWSADPTTLDPTKTLTRFTLLIDRSWFDPLGPIAGIVGVELLAL